MYSPWMLLAAQCLPLIYMSCALTALGPAVPMWTHSLGPHPSWRSACVSLAVGTEGVWLSFYTAPVCLPCSWASGFIPFFSNGEFNYTELL